MNLIIPLAGKDKNFEERDLCKPLVEIGGQASIKWIADSRPFSYKNAVFILLREHQKKYNLDSELKKIFGNKIKILWAEEPTAGAPHSVLLARELINNDEELIIDLPDQYLDTYGLMDFLKKNSEYHGVIPSFKSSYWNRGYMLIDENGFVRKVSEKDKIPISNDSTACISYFKRGRDFVSAAEEMIRKKRIASNGAYLISLAYNEMIEKGMKIRTYPCEFISTLGTIEGVNAFEQHLRPLK
ncbi:MAG: sugar phosphate nucleotidyltransferase [Nanoarchaeota archaeon]